MEWCRRHVVVTAAAVIAALLVFNGVSGTLLFARAETDPMAHADAVLVLGGEHDGREAYGIELGAQGYAPTVVLSNPYPTKDRVMRDACRPRPDVQVICRRPPLLTTRGEAIMARELADKYGWESIIVISWRYHLPRARKIFDQCFESPTRHVTMRDVPRAYDLSVAEWQYTYLYQYGGWLKAEIQGECGDAVRPA